MSLRIGIDATDLGAAGGSRTGVYQYAMQLLRQLARHAPQHEYRLLFGLPHPRHRASVGAALAAVGAPRCRAVRTALPMRWIRRLGLPVELWLGALDVFHAPSHLAPSVRCGAAVVTVHDLAYRRGLAAACPAGVGAAGREGWRRRQRFFAELEAGMARSLNRAARVIAVSQHTAGALVRELGICASRIRVVPLAARAELCAPLEPGATAGLRARYGLPERYGFYLGSLDPHKNLETLLRGFALHRTRAPGTALALSGARGWYLPALEELCERLGIAARVHFLGAVPDRDLGGLLAGARWTAMPSPLEGFGIPALEAMACGSPLLAAAAGALPEVAGAAALLVDPDSPAAFADAMERLDADEALREAQIRAGFARARQFSWERTARETLRVYAEALELGGAGARSVRRVAA